VEPDQKREGLLKKDFKKGHKRAHSMPSTVHKERALSNDSSPMTHDQVVVSKKVVRSIRFQANPGPSYLAVNEIEVIEESDDDSFSVSIDDEEIACLQGIDCVEADDNGEHIKYRRHRHFWQLNWKRVHFTGLPSWLQDNEFLHTGHRPPMPSFGSCFKSIFSLHTETGNIFTHMYGCVSFIGILCWFLSRQVSVISWPDRLIFSTFFIGAILCMGMSFAFHTLACHSDGVYRIFCKLDYAGIALLIVGSFIPWIHYGFYCRVLPKIIYIGMIGVLGLAAFVVSLWDKFSEPSYRHWRAIVFISMGLSSIAPTLHLAITDGIMWMFKRASFHWLILMGILYIAGAVIYALRIPERFFPGKCDIWFQSHQIFHLFVVAAAYVHFYGLMVLAKGRLEDGSCSEQLTEAFGSDEPFNYWLDSHLRPY